MTAGSLLDRSDLAALRAGVAGLPGPFAGIAACLVSGGALTHDPDDPDWADRDRLVAGHGDAASALEAALGAAGHADPATVPRHPPWEALPHATGLAAASRLDGGVFRIWCLLGADAADHGATWEAARIAASSRLDTLVALVAAPAEPCAEATRVLGAAGWRTASGRGDDPAELLGALDHALAGGPTLVTAVAS